MTGPLRYHGASREEASHGAQADTTPIPSGFSAPLADPPARGGRCGTTAAGRAQSVVAGSAPAGTPRSAAAATAHSHASATPDAARHRGHHCEPGMAAGTVHRRGAEGLDPRRLVGGCAAAGQSPGYYQTACRAAGGGDGPALCGSLYAAASPGAACPAAPELGAGAGSLPAAGHCGWLDAGSPA